MDFSTFEHVTFSTKRGFDAAIKNVRGYIGGVLVVSPTALDQLKSWKDLQDKLTAAKANVDGVDSFFGDIPIVVQGDNGMDLVLVPLKHDVYLRLQNHKA